MANTLDWKPSSPIQIVLYGPPKSGKTFGALTFPRPVVFDFDKGIATARNRDFVEKYGLRSIEYETFYEKNVAPTGVARAHNAFDDACRYFDFWMRPENKDKFDTFVVDSMTSLSNAAANKAMILLGTNAFSGVSSKTYNEAMKTGLVFPKLQDYGAERSMTEQFVRMMKDSGKNVVLICHESVEMDDDGHIVKRMPLLTGKSKQEIPMMFDEVYYIKVRHDKARIVQTQADGITYAGSRYGVADGTTWDYDSLRADLDKIALMQNTASGKVQEPNAPAASGTKGA